jgi:hypothetical protein
MDRCFTVLLAVIAIPIADDLDSSICRSGVLGRLLICGTTALNRGNCNIL